jgi:hypothetical protein
MSKLLVLAAVVVVVSIVAGSFGYAYAQDDGGTTTSGCCAVASAYDATDDGRLDVIRQFRDDYLMSNPVGRSLAALYYRVSPPVARFIDDHPSVKPVARAALMPVVAVSTVAVDTTLPEKVGIAGAFALALLAAVAFVRWRLGAARRP